MLNQFCLLLKEALYIKGKMYVTVINGLNKFDDCCVISSMVKAVTVHCD